MALLAGIERNATVAVPANQKAVVLEVTRPALRLLRKLPTFGNILDETYRTHGIGRVLEDLRLLTDKPLSEPLAAELRRTARYMVYGKNHVLCKEGDPIDRLILIKNGWVRRSHGVFFDAASPEVVLGMDEGIGVDFLGGGSCLGSEGVTQPAKMEVQGQRDGANRSARDTARRFLFGSGASQATGRRRLQGSRPPAARCPSPSKSFPI